MALKDATKNYGEAAYASHLLNTQYVKHGEHGYLSDDVKCEFGVGREQAILITDSMRLKADKIVFYIDFGYSNGMLSAKRLAEKHKIPYEERLLPEDMMKEIYD